MFLRWLLVGAGDIARKRVASALSGNSRSEIGAVCDTNATRASTLAADYSVPFVYESYQEALRDDRMDAVYLATPVGMHETMAIEALRAGKHVLVEKPMALTASGAIAMSEAAVECGRKLGVAYFRRCSERFRHARSLLQSGELGTPVLARMTYYTWYNPEPADQKRWRVVKEISGAGVIGDMGAHMFDVLIGLVGLPSTVYASVNTAVHSYDVEDSAAVVLNYRRDFQAIASFHWCSKVWHHEFEVVGTDGRVRWQPFDGDSVAVTRGRETELISFPQPENVHSPLVDSFVSWVLDQSEFACRSAEALKTNIVIDALFHAAEARCEVSL